MIGIKVCRGSSFSGQCKESDPALNWGPDISDNLLTTEEAARERGASEINKSYSNRKETSFTSVDLGFVQPGTFAGMAAETYQINGIIQNTSIKISRSDKKFSANATFMLEGGV